MNFASSSCQCYANGSDFRTSARRQNVRRLAELASVKRQREGLDRRLLNDAANSLETELAGPHCDRAAVRSSLASRCRIGNCGLEAEWKVVETAKVKILWRPLRVGLKSPKTCEVETWQEGNFELTVESGR